LTLNITARSQSDRHPARYEYERCWSCEVLMERGFSRIRTEGRCLLLNLPYVNRHSKMAYDFFFLSDHPLEDSPQLRPSGYFTVTSSIGRIKHFEDLILIPPIAVCLGIGVLLRDAYLERLPGALREKQLPSGEKIQKCVYSPHSLRATKATLLLMPGSPFESAQDLLDANMTTTQIYDKRRRSVRDSASHKVPI